MSKATTSQVNASENKNVIEKLSYEDFAIVCGELNVVEDALRELWAIATSTDDEKLRVDIFKWLIEMNIGKAKQATDITSKGEQVTAGIFIDNSLL